MYLIKLLREIHKTGKLTDPTEIVEKWNKEWKYSKQQTVQNI